MSTERQFYTFWQMYATQNKGSVINARYQYYDSSSSKNAEYRFYDAGFIGTVMKASNSAFNLNTGNTRSVDTAKIIKQVFQCKAVDHANEPNVEQAAAL